jgi:shikimate kinase
MTSIILIGMPGAGKSTVGVILAKALGKTFIDTDIMIQEDCGRLLPEMIVLNTVSMTSRSLKRGGDWSI